MSPEKNGRLAGKVALITGGGSGIGRGTALLFAEEGASVVLADLNHDAVKETAQSIQDAGGRAIALKVDVTSSSDSERMAEETIKAFSRIDILLQTPASPVWAMRWIWMWRPGTG